MRGIEDGWFTSEIADAAFAYQRALEKGDKQQVGVTVHTDTIEAPLEILRISHEVERDQVALLGQRKQQRDEQAVAHSLAALRAGARTDENLIPAMLDAARREATLGEMCDVLRQEWASTPNRPGSDGSVDGSVLGFRHVACERQEPALEVVVERQLPDHQTLDHRAEQHVEGEGR